LAWVTYERAKARAEAADENKSFMIVSLTNKEEQELRPRQLAGPSRGGAHPSWLRCEEAVIKEGRSRGVRRWGVVRVTMGAPRRREWERKKERMEAFELEKVYRRPTMSQKPGNRSWGANADGRKRVTWKDS
jgi:hypothetical protein